MNGECSLDIGMEKVMFHMPEAFHLFISPDYFITYGNLTYDQQLSFSSCFIFILQIFRS